jgi:hypothetical protein
MAAKNSSGRHEFSETAPIAVVVEGVSEEWDQNVLQVMATPGRVHVDIAGRGTVTATAFRLSRDQARRLAVEITQILGSESGPASALTPERSGSRAGSPRDKP